MTPKQTLRWIALPMLVTFVLMRLYLHLVRVQHVYPGGYLVHHLYTGALLVIASSFVLAFTPGRLWVARGSRMALGIGSALVLDEMTYLVMTKASDDDYISPISLWGGVGFVALAIALLAVLAGREGWK
jgi:hypothetical protein